MLSYRHAFHAGNHADVLKHTVFVHLLRYLAHKEKPFWCIDTHAGAALHDLGKGYAAKKAEYQTGISRIWGRQDLPGALADYLQQVRSVNPDGDLRFYPGSPQIAWQLLRRQDRLRLFELHSTESARLQDFAREAGHRVVAQAGDGFIGLQSVLPPPSRRALVLIDPSYEDKRDYAHALAALRDALQRFATGVYALWYPQVQRAESRRLPELLKRVRDRGWLHVTLSVKAPVAGGLGLHGSGMFVLNPPWTLAEALGPLMPYLVKVLGQDAGASFCLESEPA